MLTSELTEYLKTIKKLDPPPNDGDLHDALKTAGWNDQDIKEAIAFIRKPDTPVVAPRATPVPVSSPARESLPLGQAKLQTGVDLSRPEIEAPHLSPRAAVSPVSSASPQSSPFQAGNSFARPAQPTSVVSPASPTLVTQKPALQTSVSAQPRFGAEAPAGVKPVSPVSPVRTTPSGPTGPTSPVHEPFSMKMAPEVAPAVAPTATLKPGTSVSTNEPRRSFIGMGAATPSVTPGAMLGSKPVQAGTVVSGSKSLTPTTSGHASRSIAKLVVFLLIAVIVLGGGGFGAFAYYKGWVTLPSFLSFTKKKQVAPYTEANFVEKLFDTVVSIKSYTAESSARLNVSSRDADAAAAAVDSSAVGISTSPDETPLPGDPMTVEGAEASIEPLINPLLAFIPSDVDAGFKLSSKVARPDNAPLQMETSINFDYKAGGLINMEIAADVRVTGGSIYVNIKKFPELLSTFSGMKPVLNQWVKFDLKELEGKGSLGAVTTLSNDIQEDQQRISQLAALLRKIIDEERVITFIGEPVVEQEGERDVYRYSLTINREKIISAYKRFAAERKVIDDSFPAVFGETPVSQTETQMLYEKDLARLESEQTTAFFDYLKKNVTISMWFDALGMPVKHEVKARIIPGDAVREFKGKQFNLLLTGTVSGINAPVVVETPPNSITLDEALAKAGGMTDEEYKRSKQSQNVEKIRTALDNYKTYSGAYPDKLADLAKKGSELTIQKVVAEDQKFTNTWVESQYKDRAFLAPIPADIFSGKDFVYALKGEDYELGYVMSPAVYKKGTSPLPLINFVSVSGKTVYTLSHVDGLNTANAKTLSVQAVAGNKLDTDADNVSDLLERALGTDLKKKDTDGDKINDADEITRGTDPLGPGKTTSIPPLSF